MDDLAATLALAECVADEARRLGFDTTRDAIRAAAAPFDHDGELEGLIESARGMQ